MTEPGRKINRALILLRARRCGNKQGFLTRQTAIETAQAAHPRTPMDAYECWFCGKWHYGKRRGS